MTTILAHDLLVLHPNLVDIRDILSSELKYTRKTPVGVRQYVLEADDPIKGKALGIRQYSLANKVIFKSRMFDIAAATEPTFTDGEAVAHECQKTRPPGNVCDNSSLKKARPSGALQR